MPDVTIKPLQMAAISIFWVVGLFLVSSGAVHSQTLILGYGKHFNAPYVKYSGQDLIGGWVFDVAKSLAREMKTDVRTIGILRKRTGRELESGHIDTYCFSNPKWINNSPKIRWTPPLYNNRNIVIATHQRAAKIKTANDLKGLRVGTILGYNFPNAVRLTEIFDKKLAIRFDNASFEANLRMLARSRLDAVIYPEHMAKQHLAKLNMRKSHGLAPYIVSDQSIHCAIAKNTKFSHNRIHDAYLALKKQGLFNW